MGRRRQPIMTFQEAFNLTKGLTGSILSAKEVEKLGPDAEAVKGVGLKITAPDGTQSTGVVDPAAGGDFDAITKAYTDQGYKVEKLEAPQYAARSGSKDTGVYADENAAKMGARETNQGLKMKRADVYEKYGLEDKAKGLRAESRQDRLDMQNTQRHEQQMATGKLELDEKTRAAKQVSTLDAGLVELNGMEFETPEARASALVSVYEKAFGPAEAMKIRKMYTDQDLSAMQLQSKKLDHAWEQAFQSGRAESLGEVFDKVNNDRNINIVRGKGGIEIIEYDPRDPNGTARIVVKGKDDAEVIDKARMLVTPGAKLEWAKYELDMLKAKSQARANDASAAKDYAQAELYGRTDPNAKAGAGTDNLNALTNYANSLNTEVANIDKALMNMPPMRNEPAEIAQQRKALIEQKGKVMTSLSAVRQQIEQGRLGIQPPQAAEPPPLTDAQRAAAMNVAAKAVRSGEATLEEVNAKLKAEGIPELSPDDIPNKKKGLTRSVVAAPQGKTLPQSAEGTMKHLILT